MLSMLKNRISSLFIALLMAISLSVPSTYAQEPPDEDFPPPGMHDMEPGMGPMFDQNGERPHMKHGGNHQKFGKNMGEHGIMRIFKELNLTEDQKSQIKSKRESLKGQIKPLREQMRTEQEKLMDLMFNANSSKSEILAQHNKVSSLRNNMAKIRLEQIISLKEVLTPEQKSKLQTLAQEKKAKMKERMSQFKENRGQFRENFKNRDNNEPEPNF